MKTMSIKKPEKTQSSEVHLYQVGSKLVAVRQKPKAPAATTLVPERKFLGTVVSESGKLSVTDPSNDMLERSLTLTPGLGEGAYDAYATVQHVPGHGERITKIEMEFIPDWELQEYRRMDAMEDASC